MTKTRSQPPSPTKEMAQALPPAQTHTPNELKLMKELEQLRQNNDTLRKNNEILKQNSETYRKNCESLKQAGEKQEQDILKLKNELEKVLQHIHAPTKPIFTPKTGAIPKQPAPIHDVHLTAQLNTLTQDASPTSPILINDSFSSHNIARQMRDDKLPQFIENVITQTPLLNTYDPNSIIQWLEHMYNIHIRYHEYFAIIIKRILTCSQSSYLQRLMGIYTPNITFQEISNKVLQDLTTNEIRMQYNLHYIFRKQGPQEPFREFAEDILKYGFILASYTNAELINCILSHSNEITRNKFLFQKQPNTLIELKDLISKVEKLELSDRQTTYPIKYISHSREDLSHLLQDMDSNKLVKQVSFQADDTNTHSDRPFYNPRYTSNPYNNNQGRFNYTNNRNNYNRNHNNNYKGNNYRGNNYRGNNYDTNYRQINRNREYYNRNNYNGHPQNQPRRNDNHNYNNRYNNQYNNDRNINNNYYRQNNNMDRRRPQNTQYNGGNNRNFYQNKQNGQPRAQFNYMRGTYETHPPYTQYMPYQMPYMPYYPHPYPFPTNQHNTTNVPPANNTTNASNAPSNPTNPTNHTKTYNKQKRDTQNHQIQKSKN